MSNINLKTYINECVRQGLNNNQIAEKLGITISELRKISRDIYNAVESRKADIPKEPKTVEEEEPIPEPKTEIDS